MNATKILAASLLALSTLLAASQASAQGFHIGGSVGKSDIDDEVASGLISSGPVDGSDSGFKFFGGYQFNPYLGLELAYIDLGKASYSGLSGAAPVTGGTVEIWGINVSAVGTYPLNSSFALFGKAGLFAWEAKAKDVTGGVPFSAKEDGVDLSLGIGFSYNFTKNFGARVEWERFLMDVADADLLSVGIVYKF